MTSHPMRRILKIAAVVAILAALLWLAYTVKRWACEGATNPIRCMVTR